MSWAFLALLNLSYKLAYKEITNCQLDPLYSDNFAINLEEKMFINLKYFDKIVIKALCVKNKAC